MIKPRSLRPSSTNILDSLQNKKLTLDELKIACKEKGITNTVDYKQRYRDIAGFPAHPERVYASEWTSYKDLFDIPAFISYDEMRTTIHPLQLKNGAEYKKYVASCDNPRFPLDPQTVYDDDWKNWFVFLGKEEPLKPDFIPLEYQAWADKIVLFMKQARGGGTKESHICRFVRYFIQQHDKSPSPEAFLTKKPVNIKPFRNILEEFETDNLRRNVILAVNQFLDYVIDHDLTDEDEETGEIVRVLDARNPLSLLLTNQSVRQPQRTESTKPCLPYHFVKKVQSWIIPSTAKTFRDLKHIQKFDADWVKVDASYVNTRDPDCVYKNIGGQYFLWIPTDWVHAYCLTKVPLRGRQIAYNDSGEGDDWLADIDEHGKIRWTINDGLLAGTTKSQSFIKRMPDDEIGMFVTTNKTGSDGGGYSIPWMPEDLAFWLVKLRKWQQQYNSISAPTSWETCKRTSFNEHQLKAKGLNCFLFREYGGVEPRNVSAMLSPRLAAALYKIQPSDLTLATLTGHESTFSHYSSKFTPHSMRVSLITAYVMEMGMPIEIVMKVVGHSSVVMSIYYTKITSGEIRKKLEEGEKVALKSQAQATQSLIEQNKIEEVKNNLIATNQDALSALTNDFPAGNFVFRDYGICPYAASRCGDGGNTIGSTKVREPVPAGYLGMQNCIRCRHFITSPAFLGGLLSITNEILLLSNNQSHTCRELQNQISQLENQLGELDKIEYVANIKGEPFDSSRRIKLEADQRRLESDYESAAKKLDMLLCDIQSAYRLIRQCQTAIDNAKTIEPERSNELALIATSDSELQLDLEEVSYYQQLNEVCENAIIYQSASAENAILPRSQLLDRMAHFNSIAPSLFMLSKEEQLIAGNELHKLFINRLKSWDRLEQVVNCKVKISELLDSERISETEITLITKPEKHLT